MLTNFEHIWLSLAFNPIDYPTFNHFLVASCMSSGVSDSGCTYSVLGTRCSGDAHTSLGNGILNHFLTFLMTAHLERMVSYHEGDDGVIATNDDIEHMFEILPDLGFLIKVDKYKHINDVSFCGMFLLDDKSELKMYSDPWRCLSKIHTACADGKSHNLIVAKAMSVLNLNPATPIITAFCMHVLRVVESPLLRPNRRQRFLNTIHRVNRGALKVHVDLDVTPSDITGDVRASFAHRTGISPSEQLRCEDYLKNLTYIPESYQYMKRELVLDDASSTIFNMHDSLYA